MDPSFYRSQVINVNMRTTFVTTLLIAFVLAFPATVGAKDNDIEQENIKANARDNEELISAEWELWQGGSGGNGPLSRGDYGVYDSAMAAANCQFVLGAEVALAAIATASALGIISDEDDVAVTEAPGRGMSFEGLFDEESATATCTTPIGPVLIDITTASGWGTASPHGTLADAMTALNGGGYGGKGSSPENDLDQKYIKAGAELDDVVHAEWHAYQSVSNGAASAANCQAVIAARAAVLASGTSSAQGEIEDSDSVVITSEGSLGASDIGVDFTDNDLSLLIDIQNDHISTSSCNQPIESISILIRPQSSTLPQRS